MQLLQCTDAELKRRMKMIYSFMEQILNAFHSDGLKCSSKWSELGGEIVNDDGMDAISS